MKDSLARENEQVQSLEWQPLGRPAPSCSRYLVILKACHHRPQRLSSQLQITFFPITAAHIAVHYNNGIPKRPRTSAFQEEVQAARPTTAREGEHAAERRTTTAAKAAICHSRWSSATADPDSKQGGDRDTSDCQRHPSDRSTESNHFKHCIRLHKYVDVNTLSLP